VTPGLRERLKELPDCFLSDPDGWRLEREAAAGVRPAAPDHDGRTLELNCRDVKATLVRVVALLNELKVELISLETEEPNLERVFLHLTGRELRD
jgi:hypothetical protein